MQDFNHVDDKITRGVLLHTSTDEDSICHALDFAAQCLQADQHNEDVSFEVYASRVIAFESACDWWNEEARLDKTVESLQDFWSI